MGIIRETLLPTAINVILVILLVAVFIVASLRIIDVFKVKEKVAMERIERLEIVENVTISK